MAERSALSVAAALLLGAGSIVPGAMALAASGGAVKATLPRDPANIAGMSEVVELCLRGNQLFLAKSLEPALALYRDAAKLGPKNPLPPYLEAEVLLELGKANEAEGALERARELTDRRTAALRSKVLFVLAISRERQKKWEAARAAWREYNDWAFNVVDGGGSFPMTASERIKAVEEALRREQAMAIVRERADATAEGTLYNNLPGRK